MRRLPCILLLALCAFAAPAAPAGDPPRPPAPAREAERSAGALAAGEEFPGAAADTGEPGIDLDSLTCPVCWDPLDVKTFTVTRCCHAMHRKCLESAVKYSDDFCPACQEPGAARPKSRWGRAKDKMLPSGRRSPSYRRRRHLKHVLTELGGAGPSDPAGDRAALQLICDYRVAEDEAAQGAENEAAEDAAVEDETEEERAVRLLRRRPLKWDSFIAARLKTFLDLVEIIITDIAEAFSLAEVAGGDEMSEAAGDDEFPARPVRLRPRLAPIWLPPYPDVPDGAGDRNADINKWLLLNRRGIHRMRMLTDRPPRDNLKSLLLTPFVEPKGAFLARARLMFWILLKMRTLAAGAAPPGTAIPPVRFVGRLRDLGVPDGWLEALETGGGVGLDLENDLPAPFRIPAAAAGWLAASAHVLCESLREEALRCCSGPGAPGLDPALWRERVFDLNDLLLTLVFSATDDEDYPRFYKYTSYALKMRRLLADPPETDAEFRAKHSDPFSRSRRLMSEETSNILHWQ